MDTVNVNKFRDNLKKPAEQSLGKHEPFRVTRRSGEDFVVTGAEDWEREPGVLNVLHYSNLMQQSAESAIRILGEMDIRLSKFAPMTPQRA